MPLTVDGEREEGAKYGYFPPPTPETNGPYILDLRINSAHLPGGVLQNFQWSALDGFTGGPLLFIEPYSKTYKPQERVIHENQFEANGWFKNWYRKFKSVKFEFSGTDIVGWRVAVDGQYINSQGAVIDSSTGDRFATFDLDYTIWENNTPGSWQLINVTEVPLPAGGILLASGLFILALRRRLTR
ncbi:VPLPA-CTERM sorting domain-containing protein [Pseudooceanicola sp.]|uniref:VPLPA-CTERM sorting domain-containing protein n=1 Tax=Pseudooceanicola sp. TaxID=1914328 RepID=UPI0035182A1F